MPDFIIIGAVKAGTTSLYHYLGQHPEIQMSRENWPRFFHVDTPAPNFERLKAKYGTALLAESLWRFRLMCHPGVPRTLNNYELMWPQQKEKKLHGEVSPTYLHDASVPEKIKSRFPDVKLIVVIRQPAKRAYSHFVMDVTRGWVPERNFVKALKQEAHNIDEFWWGLRHYIRHGFYAKRIENLLNTFDKEQIKIMLYDDFQSSAENFMKDIYSFIGVDSRFKSDMSKRHNQGLILAKKRKDGNGNSSQLMKPPPMPDKVYRSLTDFFSSDIKQLQDIISRDLSIWLK